MKKMLLTIGAALSVGVASAQLEAGSIAPDFTLTDINGVSQHLYNYLDSGYTVIIDVSATWCGPCWAVHSSHVFEDLTTHYGPQGTITAKKIKVLFIEGDASTTAADLQGAVGGNTQGNWIAGTNYPIIDNATQNAVYLGGGYPTFTVICPNKLVKEQSAGYSQAMLSEAYWTALMGSCEVATQPNDAALLGADPVYNVCIGQSVNMTANLQNMGTTPLTSATVNALVNGAVVGTVNWTGNLSTYQFAPINFPAFTPQTSNPVTYQVTAANDGIATNNTKNGSFEIINAPLTQVTVQFKLDQYPSESGWSLKDGTTVIGSKNNYVGAGTAPGGQDADSTFLYTYTIPANACLTFEVTDAYGDGMNEAGTGTAGFAKVYSGATPTGTPIINIAGSSYTLSAKKNFKQGVSTGISSLINTSEIKLVPNPASQVSTLSITLLDQTQVSLQVFDAIGRVVYALPEQKLVAGTQQFSIPTDNLAPGMYNVVVRTPAGKLTERLAVTK
jgi:thiol-disulfide isomerase/thioredoxin